MTKNKNYMKAEGWHIVLIGAIVQTVLNVCLFLLMSPFMAVALPLAIIDQSTKEPPFFIINVMFLNLVTYVVAIWMSFSNYRKLTSLIAMAYGLFLILMPITKIVDLGQWLFLAPVSGIVVFLGGFVNVKS